MKISDEMWLWPTRRARFVLAIQHDEIVGALDALNVLRSALNALNVSWVVVA